MAHFDIETITASKKEFRRDLASRPIAEKLRLLDELHKRALTLRKSLDMSKRKIDGSN